MLDQLQDLYLSQDFLNKLVEDYSSTIFSGLADNDAAEIKLAVERWGKDVWIFREG